MFVCGLCHKLSEPRQKAAHVVVETRPITQPDTGQPGTAIVKEVLAHQSCIVLETALHELRIEKGIEDARVALGARAEFQEKVFDRMRAMGAQEVQLP